MAFPVGTITTPRPSCTRPEPGEAPWRRSRPGSSDAFAVIADVHGNSWALGVVLEEIRKRGISDILNLGDCFYGPLDPAGTLEILRTLGCPTVRGNEDRCLLEDESPSASATQRYTLRALGKAGLEWLESNTRPPFEWKGMLLCHGTPRRDNEYLLNLVSPGFQEHRGSEGIDSLLPGCTSQVVLCAHSHLPGICVTARGNTVINPGSVGLPAYQDDHPYPHRMESGSPLASFAVVHEQDGRLRVEHVRVSYDEGAAAKRAEENGRPDWRDWLLTGFANPGRPEPSGRLSWSQAVARGVGELWRR